jgi:hypothetical protein
MKNHLQEIEVNGLVYGAKTMTFHMSCAFLGFPADLPFSQIWENYARISSDKDPLIFRNCSPILLGTVGGTYFIFRNARFTQWVKGNPIL